MGTKQLQKLMVHDTVQIQNQVGNHPSRWDVTGTIVEVRPYDQYVIKVHGSGRLTARNRKLLRKIEPYAQEKTPVFKYTPPSPDLSAQDDNIVPEIQTPPADVDQPVVDIPDADPPTRALGGHDEQSPIPTQPPVVTRQSKRTCKEPERLEMTWKGQSYEKHPQNCITAGSSITYSLHPARPGGGEGINGDGVGYNLWNNPYQSDAYKHRSFEAQPSQTAAWGSHLGLVTRPGW